MGAPHRRFGITVALNTILALALTGLFAVFDAAELRSHFWRTMAINQIYTHCTGDLAALVISPFAIRMSRWSGWKKWPPYLALLVVVGASGAALGTLATTALGLLPALAIWSSYAYAAKISIIVTVTMGTAIYGIELLRGQVQATTLQLRTQQLERERALKLAAEARFDSLQSRLQPHFLFNTINSILALLPEDAKRAEEMLERLARLLRFALDSQQAPVVRLRDELRLVSDYLEIERTRFGERLRFTVEASPDLDNVEIPAYSLQTLVENSMKHAIATRREGGRIAIHVAREGDYVVAEVSDDGPGFSRDALRPGHGLDMLESRLAALYGAQSSVEIDSAAGGACVRFRVPATVTV